MTTLLLAEGLISEEEGRRSEDASATFEAKTGGSPDVAAEQEPGDFFLQAQAMLDRSLERGIITADEAGTFRDTFARIQAALSQGTRS